MVRRTAKPGSPDWKDPRVQYARSEFRPYATTLGRIALAWNGLHERLAFLFCMLMGGGQVNHFFAAWYAIKNDRSQREMLGAVTKVDISNLSALFPKMQEEVAWILARCNDVEEARNNALHSPLVLMHRGVEPAYHMGHERANKLAKRRDLLAELRWCQKAATGLSDYVYAIDRALEDIQNKWPDRPKWPTREDTKRKPPGRQDRPSTQTPRPQQIMKAG
jgi:hypothetical protein